MRWAKIGVLLALAASSPSARGQAQFAQQYQSVKQPPVAQQSPATQQTPATQPTQNAQAAASAPVYITRQRAFSFPISVPPAATLGGEPALVELWFSRDRGANWQKYDAKRPNAGPFVVQTDRDGEYYFASRILDPLNRALYQPAQLPERRVIVDTVPPRIEFSASPGLTGEVQGAWRIVDEYLKPDSVALEYQAGPSEPWRPLAFDRPAPDSTQTDLTGSATWYPQTNELTVSVRATAYDWAGNSNVVARTVVLRDTPPSAAPLASSGAPEASMPNYGPASQNMAPALPQGSPSNGLPTQGTPNYGPVATNLAPGVSSLAATAPAVAAAGTPVAAATTSPVVVAPPLMAGAPSGRPAPPSPAPASSATPPMNYASNNPPSAPNNTALAPAAHDPIPWPSDNAGFGPAPPIASEYPYRDQSATAIANRSAAPPLLNSDRAATMATVPERSWGADSGAAPQVSPVSDSAPRRLAPPPAPPIGPHSLPGGERPRMSNARKFNLEYDVSAVGPLGVAKVELWLTRDAGQNWQAWAEDPDRQSPMEVSLADEGVYGFRVVVTGRNGHTGPIPSAGEMADVWIGIDTTPPLTRLTAAKYGAGKQAGQLDIRWEADDVMLASRPVTLLFSESPNGPWTIIATGLPNTGSYNWPVDPRTPRQIYLRIETRDEAGNLGIDQLREPITLEGLQPKARVKGIQPVEEVGLKPRPSVLFR